MKIFGFIVFLVVVSAGLCACGDSGNTPGPFTGIEGRVYSIATPGPTPIGWIPPPLEQISTILVLDSNHKFIFEVLTDNKGRFATELRPGTYYLRVKESMISAETGPYVVMAGELTSVRAHYDNGMR